MFSEMDDPYMKERSADVREFREIQIEERASLKSAWKRIEAIEERLNMEALLATKEDERDKAKSADNCNHQMECLV